MLTFAMLIKDAIFLIIGLLGVGFLIAVHEFGHFLFCKLFRISTPSFSIGMGPVLLKRKIGETVFSLSLLPIGGYVEIAGNEEVGQGEQAQAKRHDQHSFAVKPYYQKLLVMVGGILFNLGFAYLAIILLFMTGVPETGLLFPERVPALVGHVASGSAAAKAGLQTDDQIVQIDTLPVATAAELNQIVMARPAQTVQLQVLRQGQTLTLPATIDSVNNQGQPAGRLGIGFKEALQVRNLAPLGLIDSITTGIKTTNQLIYKNYLAFKNLCFNRCVDGIGGPISLIAATKTGAEKGCKFFVILLAFISIGLAVLNIIPVPIMDGGQILFVTLEALMGRPVPAKVRLVILYACWVLVLGLIAYLSFADLKRLFWGKISALLKSF